MPTDKQIMIVATGYYPDVADYLFSENWERDRPGFIVDREGTIHGGQGDQHVIALENVGVVKRLDGRWVPATHPDITGLPIVPYEYCSCRQAHEMISTRQLNALHRLLKSLLSQFGITFPYCNQLGKVCKRAIAGGSGIFFASSYDKQRSDIHPQIELLNIIKALASC